MVHAWLALSSTVNMALTVDELPHLAAGHAYWTHHATQLHPENGILPQRWAALPAVIQGETAPDPTHPAWQKSDIWSVGLEYLYDREVPPEIKLLEARGMAVLWNLATGLLIYAWSRSLFGATGGFFSLSFFAFCPTFLANGPLVTSDACASFFLLAAVWSFWNHLNRADWLSLLLSSIAFGLCCVAKFSAALLLPLFGLLLGYGLLCTHANARMRLFQAPFRNITLGVLVHAGIAGLIIWSFYGFECGASPAFQTYHFTWEAIQASLGWKATLLAWLRDHQLLPSNYIHGFSTVLYMSKQRGAFLNGELSLTGWPWFFPYCFLAKSTLTTLGATTILLLWKGRALIDRLRTIGRPPLREGRLHNCAPLLLFLGVFWLSSITLNLNIGHRHIMPVYPALYILFGCLGAACASLKHRKLGLLLLLLPIAFQAAESNSVRPHYIAYFNPLVGGPEQGYTHLVDSSLDWGQDLPALQDWLDKDPQAQSGAPAHLIYFGMAPIHHHIPKAKVLFSMMHRTEPSNMTFARAGLYCVSATMLQQPYAPPREWTLNHERRYQQLRGAAKALIDQLHTLPKAQRSVSRTHSDLFREYEGLRYRRLCAVLRERKPDAMAGYSILVYRLNSAEVHAALEGNWSEWLKLREQQAIKAPH